MTRYKIASQGRALPWIFLSMLALGCSGTSNDSSADEASVVPGSTCEATDDYSAVDLELRFPGRLNAAEIIAVTRWSNADSSCAPDAALWATNFGRLTGVASWGNGAVYVRQLEELFVEEGARIAVLMDCPEAHLLGAEVRLDMARDGRGKLMAKCTDANP